MSIDLRSGRVYRQDVCAHIVKMCISFEPIFPNTSYRAF
jgi:hypothetical protein